MPRQSTADLWRTVRSQAARWICHGCNRRGLCICADSQDTTLVDIIAFDDQPTAVFVRESR